MRGVPRERRATSTAASSVRETSEDVGRAAQDPLELRLGVVVEPIGHAEAVAQRAGDAADTRGRADHGDVLDLEPHGPRAGSLPEHDVEREVLHGRVQDLLDDMAEPMDLVDEQHIALAQGGEHGRQVAGALDGRPGGRADLRAHLGRHDVGQRGLAEPRRAIEENVVDRLGPMLCRIDQDGQVLLDPILTGELVESSRPYSRLQGELVGRDLRRGDALDRHR